MAYIGFGGEDPSAHGFVALGVVGLLKGRDGTQAVGKPEDDSSQTSRLVSDVGDDPFHRNMCFSRGGGWGSAHLLLDKYSHSLLDFLVRELDLRASCDPISWQLQGCDILQDR